MSSDESLNFENINFFFLTEENFEETTKKFEKEITPFLERHKDSMLVLKDLPELRGFSTTFGSYTGRQMALYIGKNEEKLEKLKRIDLNKFYLENENELITEEGTRIHWRTNKLINVDTKELVEIEFIPMAFRGDFLLEVFKASEVPIPDVHMLIRVAVEKVGRLFHDIITKKGYFSSYPRPIKDFDKIVIKKIEKEIKKADFFIEFRFVEKSLFLSAETEIINKFSESPLEKKMGFELIKEGIPFLVQYEIRKNKKTISKPDFCIFDPSSPIAIFCDSYKYHERKKDQSLRDKRIDRKLQKRGIIVLRFTDEEINTNLEGCIEEIKEHYLGEEYALSSREVFIRKLRDIQPEKLSEWEKRFVESLKNKLSGKKDISLKEERILNQILKKLH